MTCRYDRHEKVHLIDGEPCTHDEYGNPVRHCRVRTRCAAHLRWDEYACPECVGKTRANLETMTDLMALMPDEALHRGIESEPANLAGPHADYVTTQWRLVNASRAGETVEEWDDRDPYTCLTMHERTIREDLGHDDTLLVSPNLTDASGYLMWVLTDLARSEGGAIVLGALLADTARLRSHMEAALSDSRTPERGAPCPTCVSSERGAPRLVRRYAEGQADDRFDRWQCPQDREHEWMHGEYLRWVEERNDAKRERMKA